jgi:hypothetical protein
MLARLGNFLGKTMTLKQAIVILAFCMLLSAAFAFGAAMGHRTLSSNLAPAPQSGPPPGWEYAAPFASPPRGTFGAIDEIEGDMIQVRDPRSGRTWRVRAGNNTVIEFGRHKRIPFENLQVGQRIFVVGTPKELESGAEFDAQFIGVVLGQQQRFMKPVVQPMSCWDCWD